MKIEAVAVAVSKYKKTALEKDKTQLNKPMEMKTGLKMINTTGIRINRNKSNMIES